MNHKLLALDQNKGEVRLLEISIIKLNCQIYYQLLRVDIFHIKQYASNCTNIQSSDFVDLCIIFLSKEITFVILFSF